MDTVKISRALGLGLTAALVASAFSYTAASAAPAVPDSLLGLSADGPVFRPADYATGDVAVQVRDASQASIDVDDAQDLEYVWTVTPFAGGSPLKVPANGVDEQETDVDGRFVVPLPVDQGPGHYELTAGLVDDNGTVLPDSTVLDLMVGDAAPTGSTAAITGLGDSTPGLVQDGTLTVTTPGSGPAANAFVTITTDHGFFTTDPATTPHAAGTRVGDLTQLGTKLTGLTDAQGRLEFHLGIARDTGFDDDGKVAAKVSVATGPTATATADWDTIAPLNGQVAIRLAPAREQENPVAPALAGNKTLFDVFALDQFGNPSDGNPVDPADEGKTIELTYSGYLKDYDYSDDSTVADLDTFGDIWVISNVAGTIDVTGRWEDAPTLTYDANGDEEAGTASVTGSASASTYEVDFNASRFSIASSVSDTVRVGTAVTQTVRVVDQQGNPVNGYQVRFLRYGPDDVRGDVVAVRTTNALGEATYSFVGTRRGRATITAEVSDGNRRRELTGTAAFGTVVKAKLARDTKRKKKGSADRLAISTTRLAAGARVQVYRVVKGKQYQVASRTLNRQGKAAFTIRDRNRNRKTTYVAIVRSTSVSMADQSNSVTTR